MPASRDDPLGLETAPLTELQRKTGGGWPTRLPPARSMREPYRAYEQLSHARKEVSSLSDKSGHGILPKVPSSDPPPKLSPPRKKAAAAARAAEAAAAARGDAGEHGGDGEAGEEPWWQSALDGGRRDRGGVDIWQASAEREEEDDPAPADPADPASDSPPSEARGGPLRKARRAATGAQPSNRSEALLLSRELERRLCAVREPDPLQGGRMMSAYHEEKRVYDTIFRKVVEQVAVHCAERGDLLETLRSFYARSTDTTARMAERSLRAVYDKRLAHAEAEIAFLRQEAEELRNKQVPSSVEHAIMYMFRTLEQRKQQRVLGVLWTEGSRLLMRCEDCETLLPPPEQAEVLNDSLLLHIEPARLDTLTALMGARPLPEQVKLCTMFLASLPEAELLHIVMQVLGPEQQRRLFLSIFDLLETEDEKPRAMIELLQTMQSKDAINLMASVLTSPGAPDFVALVSHALSPALTTEEKCINVLASLLCNVGTETASRAIKVWARQLKKTEGGAPKLEHADSDSDSFDDSSDEDGSPRKGKPDFNLKIKEVFSELLSAGTATEANFIFEQLMHEMDEKQRAKLLPSLLSNVQRGELSNLIPQILASNMDALLLPAAQVELKSQLSEIGAVASRFASLLLSSLRPQARLESLRHLTSQDVFGDAEIQVLADYLARVAPSFLEQAQAAVVADPLISPRVAKRRTKKDEGAELIPVDHTTHAVAEIIAQKVREDAKADKKAKPRIQMVKFLRDYLLRTYGFKKVADKSGRDLRYSIRHAASSKGPYATRMHIFGQVFNVLSEYPRWPEPKVDFFFALVCRCLWYDRTASLQQAAQRRKSRRSSTKDKEPLEEAAKPAVKAPTGFSVEGEVVGPTNMKELLQKPLLQVKLPAVHSAIDALVINAEMAASLKGEMDAVSEAEPVQGNDKGQKRVINMDYVLTIMMQSWQQAADKRLAKNNAKLEKLFEETDDNKNGTLEFKEFKALTDRLMNKNSDQLTPVSVMDLFDEAITVSSEKEGEEMDAVTKEAFVEVFARSNLISMEPFAFADAQELARKLFASISAPKALRRTNVISNSNKEGATASQEEAVEVIEKDPRVRAIIKDAVRNNFLFRYLDDDMLNVVVGYMQPLAVRLGHRVIEQGDRGDYFYVAESGAYNVIVNQAHVHTYEVDEERRVFPTFGELALMYAKPRAAGVVANTDGKLWRLGRAGFRQVQAMANSSRPDPTKILRKVEIFDTLRYDQLAGLRDAMWDKTFVEGEYVFKQGDEADGFYLVSSGWAKVIKSVEETTAAQSIEVMTLGPASYFGERALLHKEPRSASVRVESEELHCLFISTQEFENRLGSLSEMIDKSRREREAAAEAKMKELEAFGLGSAQRGSFGFEGVITPIIDGQTATERLYLARHLPTGKLYTVRQQLKKGLIDLNAQSRLPKELEILSQINSAGNLNAALATLLRTFLTDGSVFVLFREVAVCDLRLLSDQGVMGDESILRWVAACVVNALHTLHIDHQTLYRNICVDNVYMLDSGYAALMDFRFAKRDDGKCTSLCGPISSVAPETVRGETQTPAVDVWAFGTLLFELFHGDSPWGSCDAEDTMILKRISAHKGALEMPFVSPDLVELCNALLDPIASKRPPISAVKESAWFGDTQWARMLTGELPSPLHDIAKEQATIKLDEGAGSDLVEIPLPPDVDQTWLEDISAYRFAK